jgi:hypothetical protein
MGLAEKRIQQDFLTKRIPERTAQMHTATDGATAKVVVEIDWPSIIEDKPALDSLWAYWEQPLSAIEDICSDDLGKEAIKGGVQKIVIRNVNNLGQVSASFAGGVLTVQMNFKEGGNGTPGWDTIKKIVEAGL